MDQKGLDRYLVVHARLSTRRRRSKVRLSIPELTAGTGIQPIGLAIQPIGCGSAFRAARGPRSGVQAVSLFESEYERLQDVRYCYSTPPIGGKSDEKQ